MEGQGRFPGGNPKKRLQCCPRCPAAIDANDVLVQVARPILRLAPLVRAEQPGLQITEHAMDVRRPLVSPFRCADDRKQGSRLVFVHFASCGERLRGEKKRSHCLTRELPSDTPSSRHTLSPYLSLDGLFSRQSREKIGVKKIGVKSCKHTF